MFVQAKQVPVDAQLGACGVQELTSLYLADLCTNNLLVVASFKVSALIARIDMLTVDRELTEHRQLVAYAVATLAHNYSLRHDRQRLPWTRHHASHTAATGDTERVAGTAERTTALAEGLRVSWTLA